MNPLLSIKWDDVRMFSMDGSEVHVMVKEQLQTFTFKNKAEMDAALKEWFDREIKPPFRQSDVQREPQQGPSAP